MNEQTKLLSNSLNANANAAVAQLTLQMDKLFVDKPHLRKYFLEAQVPQDADSPEAQAVAMLILNYFDGYFLQKDHVPQLFSTTAWTNYMSMYFTNSPVLCRILAETPSIWTRELFDLMQRSTEPQASASGKTRGEDRRPSVQDEGKAAAKA